jgi:hypothetical protein
MLAKFWTETAYRKFCDRRSWSFLRGEGEFLIDDAKTGTCDLTRDSATVSGGTITYAASDAGRVFRGSSNEPPYTISAADAASYTLDRVWGGATEAGAAAQVLDAYVTPPSDFRRFVTVLDTANNWQLHLWVTEEELNTWDAQRSSTGTSWAIVSRRLADITSLSGRVQYELWPYPTAQNNYWYFYQKTPDESLGDDDELLGPLNTNANLLVTLALAEAAEWPGSEDRRNPYFNLTLARAKRAMAEQEASRLEVLDEEVYSTWLEHVSWINRYHFAPIDSRYLQSHDTPYNWAQGW